MFAESGFSVAPYSATAGNVYTVVVAETALASDVVTTILSGQVFIAEAASALDVVNTQIEAYVNISESAIGLDEVSLFFVLDASVVESLLIDDANFAKLLFLADAQDTASITDVALTDVVLTAIVQDASTI